MRYLILILLLSGCAPNERELTHGGGLPVTNEMLPKKPTYSDQTQYWSDFRTKLITKYGNKLGGFNICSKRPVICEREKMFERHYRDWGVER